MEPLLITATDDTPDVALNPIKGEFFIANRSYPQDAITFYTPILNWLNEYKKEASALNKFIFKLEYFNTASSKQLYKVLLILKEIKNIHNTNIEWHFAKGDKDMQIAGIRYAKLLNMEIELVEST